MERSLPAVTTSQGSDRVLPATRVVSAAIVPFLVIAFAVLFPVPSDTGRLFAWEIKAPMTAMVLGAVYLGGAYFFVRALCAKSWQAVRGGFLPIALFATLLGITTIERWDQFNRRQLAFWLWAGLYFTTPFLILGVWLFNRGQEARAVPDDRQLPAGVATAIAVVGGLALLTGLFLFLLPQRAIALWPWPLTPLTAQVLGGVWCLGSTGLGALVDRRWNSARIHIQVAVLMLTLIAVAAGRAHAGFAPANPLTWLWAAGIAGVLLALGVLYIRMEHTWTPVHRSR
jgi:hypothetical protein